jgi:BlaI family penicillinase repressor
MRILEEKGYLKKTQVDRAYVYRPARPRQQVVGAMVRDFVDRVFDGAAGALLLHLADGDSAARLTRDERQRIRRLMLDAENGKKKTAEEEDE